MPTISSNINIDLKDLKSIISGQVNLLDTAKQAIEGVLKNPPDAIGNLSLSLRDLPLPGIDANNGLQTGFDGLQKLIPTDITTAIGPLAGELDGFFANLNERLSLPLTGNLALYAAIDRLMTMNWSLEAEATNNLAARSAALPRHVRAPQRRDAAAPILAAIEQWRAALEQLPDPLTLSGLLELSHEGLAALPRHLYPFRYLPLVDELRDKLDTVQRWRQMDGNALARSLAETTLRLRDFIRRAMFAQGVDIVALQIETIARNMQPEAVHDAATTLTQTLNALGDALHNGVVGGLADTVAQLQAQKTAFDSTLDALRAPELETKTTDLNRATHALNAQLEAQALELLAALNPPQDVEFLNLLLRPLNQLLEDVGLSAFIGSIRDLFDLLQTWIKKLNLAAVSEAAETISGESVQAIQSLQTRLLQTTAELSGWMNDARDALKKLPFQQVKTSAETGLTTFKEAVENQVNTIFTPVRQTLTQGLSTVETATEQFNPAALIEQFNEIIERLTAVLAGPEVLTTIGNIKSTITTVNGSVEGFSVKAVADPVVDVIGVVEDALGLASSLPLTDSLRKDLEKALKQLEPVEKIKALLDAILGEVRDQMKIYLKPDSVFVKFREKLDLIQQKITEYSPEHFVGENLLKPYNELLDQLERYDPVLLLSPVGSAIDSLRARLSQHNPAVYFAALEAPFNEVTNALNRFQPGALVSPLTDQFQQGIKTLTDSLPVDAMHTVLDQVQKVTDAIQRTIDTSNALHDLLGDVLQKLSGFSDADTQIEQIATEITGKLAQVDNFEAFETAVQQLAATISDIHAGPLSARLTDSIDAATARIDALGAAERLANLSTARNRLTPALVNGLPNSPNKTALQGFLNDFNPLSAAYTAPLNKIAAFRSQIAAFRESLPAVFNGWDARFHGPNSPFAALIPHDTTPGAIQTMLSETLRKQLIETFRPVFALVARLHEVVAALLIEVQQLITAFEQQLNELLAAGQAVQDLRAAIDGLLQSLKDIDLSFIATNIQGTYDDLKSQFQLLHPALFKAQLDQTFKALLAQLDLEKLLGLQTINQQYHHIIQNLRIGTSGGKSLETVLNDLKDNFKPVENLVGELDLSPQIEAFFKVVTKLLDELELELNRILEAYSKMFDAKTEVSAKVSVST